VIEGTGGLTVEAYREAADGYSQSNTDSAPFDAKLDSAPAGRTLTYDGTDQGLVTPGSTKDGIGKIEYRLERHGTYSESIPTAKDAGIYTVRYKAADSVNYTGIPAAWVKAEIQKARPSISINPTASGTGLCC
jgi:hypothetical protein